MSIGVNRKSGNVVTRCHHWDSNQMKAKAVPFELVSPDRNAQRVDLFCPCCPSDFACMECEDGTKCAVLSCKTHKCPRQRSLSHCTGSGASYDSVIFLVIDLVNLDNLVGPPRIQPTNATTVGPKTPPSKGSLSVRVVGTGLFSFTSSSTGSKLQIISLPRQLLRL